jgi:hypothetical protein
VGRGRSASSDETANRVIGARFLTGRQRILPGRQQLDVGPALVQLEPTLFDSAPDAGAELCAASPERVEERIVDLFDVDAAVLDRLDARSQLDELAGGGVRIGGSVTAFGTRDRGVQDHLPSGAWQAPSKELPASLLLIGRQLYLLSQKKDVRIFLLDLGIDAKAFKLLGVQFE